MPNRVALLRAEIESAHPGAVMRHRGEAGFSMLLPDGRSIGKYTTGPLHWRPSDTDSWQEIDVDLEDRADPTWRHGVRSARFDTLLTDDGSRRWYPRRWIPDEYVEIGPLEYRGAGSRWRTLPLGVASRVENRLGFTTASADYVIGNGGRGTYSRLTLRSPTLARPLRWQISLVGLDWKDSVLVSQAEGTQVGWLRPPSWLDSSDNHLPRPIPWEYRDGYLTVTPDLTGAVYPVTIDPDYAISASGDDGYRYPGEFNTSATVMAIGYHSAGNPMNSWMCFRGIASAKDQGCNSATVTIHCYTGENDSILSKWYGIDEDDHTPPTDDAAWQADHANHTSAGVDDDYSFPADGQPHVSPDLSAIIEELTSRAGWQSGYDIGLHYDDDGSTSGNYALFWAYDTGVPADYPLLSLTLEEPGPQFVSAGTVSSGQGALAPGLPASIEDGDLLIYSVEGEGEDANADPANADWTLVGTCASATDGAADRTRLTLYYCWYDSADPPSTSMGDCGNHGIGVITAWRGVDPNVDLTAAAYQQATTNATNNTSHSATCDSTAAIGDEVRVVLFAGHGDDVTCSAQANTSLMSVTEEVDSKTISGSDGTIMVAHGVKVSAGAVNNFTWTISASEESAAMVLLLPPPGGGVETTLDAAVRTRSAQNVGWAGTLTVSLDAGHRVRTAQNMAFLPGLLTAPLDVAVRVRTAQNVGFAPGLLTVGLDVAARTRAAQNMAPILGLLTVPLDPAARARTAADVTATLLVWTLLDAAARSRTAQNVAFLPGLATVGLDPAIRVRAAQNTGWSGFLTVPLDPAVRVRTAGSVGWSGLLTAVLDAAIRTRAAQTVALTPGAVTTPLDPAVRARTAADLNIILGLLTVPLDPAQRVRAAQNMGFTPGPATILLDPAVRGRLAQDVGQLWGAVTVPLDPAVRVRAAQALDVILGGITTILDPAVRTRTARNLVFAVREYLEQALQITRSVDGTAFTDRGVEAAARIAAAATLEALIDMAAGIVGHIDQAASIEVER